MLNLLPRVPLPSGTTPSLSTILGSELEASGFDPRPKQRLPLVFWFTAGASRTSHRFVHHRHCEQPTNRSYYDVGRSDRPARRRGYGAVSMGANFRWLGYGYVLPPDDGRYVLIQPVRVRPGGSFVPWSRRPALLDRSDDRHDVDPVWLACCRQENIDAALTYEYRPTNQHWLFRRRWVERDAEEELRPTSDLSFDLPDRNPLAYAQAEWRGAVRFQLVASTIAATIRHEPNAYFTPRQFAHSFLTGGFFHAVRSQGGVVGFEQLGTGRTVPPKPHRWNWR